MEERGGDAREKRGEWLKGEITPFIKGSDLSDRTPRVNGPGYKGLT